jgi:hypothetical protein
MAFAASDVGGKIGPAFREHLVISCQKLVRTRQVLGDLGGPKCDVRFGSFNQSRRYDIA